MTRRPGRIKLVHDVQLPRPRDVIRIRETDEYAREYGEIWHALGEEFRASDVMTQGTRCARARVAAR